MPSRTEKTPFGFINMTSNGKAITNITWASDSQADGGSDAILDEGFRQLNEYALGKRQEFDVPIALTECSDERRKWLEALRRVPYGATLSYAEFAESAGFSRKSARAAGSACANNPIPIIYPCHRILRGDGKLGNFGAYQHLATDDARNLAVKDQLIRLEKSFV